MFAKKEDKVYGLDEYGGKYAGTKRIIKTEQPYKKELERAYKELKQELNGEKPSQEKVQQRAKEIIIDGIQEKKLTEIIESDNYQLNQGSDLLGEFMYDSFGMPIIDESLIFLNLKIKS